MTKKQLVAGLFAVFVLVGGRAQAAPILGGPVFYLGFAITAETLPVSSGYTSELWLFNSAFAPLLYLANDEPAGVTTTFDPGNYGIGLGSELIFGVKILDTGNTFFLGAAARNPDNVIHGSVDWLGPGQGFIVSFEDWFGGGDLDYNDNVFKLTGGLSPTPFNEEVVPEPATLGLLGMGLAVVGFRRFRRSR